MKNQYIRTISGKPLTNSKNLVGEVVVSRINDFYASSSKALFSVKLVLNGTEKYRLNGNTFNIDENSFMVVNPKSEIEVNVDQQLADGICLFPSDELVKDVFRTRTSLEVELLDNPFEYSDLPIFTEKKHGFEDNLTGKFLESQINHIYHSFGKNTDFDIHQFYLSLSECLIKDQVKIEQLLRALNSSKKSTKEELYRRVDNAKKYIEDNYTRKISLDELAQNTYLSKYHFTRSFKSIYQISPIQYLLMLRLSKAKELLQKDFSYTEVTRMVGFSDVKNLRRAVKRNSK
ncbi:helix-turn-helix domain-containing protein [Flagellimonas nanhaiensis]|uniref:AraC family transcriptional regulator n=1 Tax=Flagellimonas nanhaiensis TaxID=2292706 RepID=A0A371JVY2_9FLAO|nr:AraC family transcriptional regulator [Allomuricauda nanhaiensis]RDY61932.1 AraC family transcriptional regulator [Allomuricauda nanhaiensis]